MKKYVGLLIIVLMLPLMSRGPAYAFTAILTDDIYCSSGGQAFNTDVLRIGNDMGSVYTSYVTYLGFKLPEKEGDQVFLTRLTECHPVDGQRTPQPVGGPGVSAQRVSRYVPFDTGAPIGRVHPVRFQVRVGVTALRPRRVEHVRPRIASASSASRGPGVDARHVLPDRVPLVSMHPPFPLLQVDRVGREIPVYDGMAVAVEVETFLAN